MAGLLAMGVEVGFREASWLSPRSRYPGDTRPISWPRLCHPRGNQRHESGGLGFRRYQTFRYFPCQAAAESRQKSKKMENKRDVFCGFSNWKDAMPVRTGIEWQLRDIYSRKYT